MLFNHLPQLLTPYYFQTHFRNLIIFAAQADLFIVRPVLSPAKEQLN